MEKTSKTATWWPHTTWRPCLPPRSYILKKRRCCRRRSPREPNGKVNSLLLFFFFFARKLPHLPLWMVPRLYPLLDDAAVVFPPKCLRENTPRARRREPQAGFHCRLSHRKRLHLRQSPPANFDAALKASTVPRDPRQLRALPFRSHSCCCCCSRVVVLLFL